MHVVVSWGNALHVGSKSCLYKFSELILSVGSQLRPRTLNILIDWLIRFISGCRNAMMSLSRNSTRTSSELTQDISGRCASLESETAILLAYLSRKKLSKLCTVLSLLTPHRDMHVYVLPGCRPCVAVSLCKEEGDSIPLAPTAPYKESLNQDGFQQLLTIRFPSVCCCCHNCMLLSYACCLVIGAWVIGKGLSPYLVVSNAGLSHECLQWMVNELSLPEMLKILGANGWESVVDKVCKNKIPMQRPNKNLSRLYKPALFSTETPRHTDDKLWQITGKIPNIAWLTTDHTMIGFSL